MLTSSTHRYLFASLKVANGTIYIVLASNCYTVIEGSCILYSRLNWIHIVEIDTCPAIGNNRINTVE